jgi:hypothetical protein
LIVLAFCTFLYGQDATRKDQTKPHIYISVESKTEDKILLRFINNSKWAVKVCLQAFTPTVPANVKKFELLNGETKFAFVNEKKVRLCYGVESYKRYQTILSNNKNSVARKKENTQTSKTENCKSSVCGFYEDGNYGGEGWVASESSILFELPAKYLKENYRIYVSYNYEWEYSEKSLAYLSPEHRIYFTDFMFKNNP